MKTEQLNHPTDILRIALTIIWLCVEVQTSLLLKSIWTSSNSLRRIIIDQPQNCCRWNKQPLKVCQLHEVLTLKTTLSEFFSTSMITVRQVSYTVPRSFISQVLYVKLYMDRLECYLGGAHSNYA